MRVRLIVLSWRGTGHPDAGGSEVFVARVCTELAGWGHEVTLFCARHEGSARDEVLEGVRIVRRGGRLGVYPAGAWWVLRHRARTDAVLEVVNAIPFGAALLHPRTVVLVHHLHEKQWQMIYPGLRGRLGWWLERRATPLAYRGRPYLAVSEATRRGLVGLGHRAESIEVVHNGVDPVVARGGRSVSPRIVVLARLVPHKRIEHALEVCRRLGREHPDLRLDVIGEGWWRERLEDEVVRLGLGSVVTLHGYLPADERDAVLARAWLMLLPSVMEGWGLAVMEAAAQGTPTLAYADAGGLAESVVDGATGQLVGDLDELIRVTSDLLRDPERCRVLGEQARSRAVRFTWAATARRVESRLEGVLGRVSRRS